MRQSLVGSVGLLLSLVAACNGDGDGKQSGAVLSAKVDREVASKLRECELLTKGDLHGFIYFSDLEPSKLASCRADCYLAATDQAGCEEIAMLACEDSPSDRIEECLTDCQSLALRCHGGGTYQARQGCDGHADCEDRSDERGCFSVTGICDDGQTVSSNFESYQVTCDGERDCEDGSDEDDCPDPVYCGNGDKVPVYQICDGVKDCAGGEDEQKCQSGQKNFHCKDSSLIIPGEALCNLYPDCPDASDESAEQGCAQLMCPAAEFQCSEKQIMNSQVCDGREDCANGEDEASFRCADLFVCKNGERITDAYVECDGVSDCRDGSDEANCGFGDGDFGDGDGDGDVIQTQLCEDGSGSYDLSQECDGIVDCLDLSDELCSSAPTSLRCSATSTVSLDTYCNGTIDCITSGRDELNCYTCPVSGTVIPSQFLCDGELDCCTNLGTCDDDSDELGCP